MKTVYYIGGPRDAEKLPLPATKQGDRIVVLEYDHTEVRYHTYHVQPVGPDTFVAVHSSLHSSLVSPQ